MKKYLFGFLLTMAMFIGFVSVNSIDRNRETLLVDETEIIEVLVLILGDNIDEDPYTGNIKAGLEEAQSDLDIELTYETAESTGEFKLALEESSKQSYDIIMCIYYGNIAVIEPIFKAYPEQRFIMVDQISSKGYENVFSITFKEHEACFLGGYLASQLSNTKKVGFIGGVEGKAMDRFNYGFLSGIKTNNLSTQPFIAYTGTYYDKEVGKEKAILAFQEGVDVVFPACGGSGLGVFEQAIKENKLMIGVDVDQSYLAPEHTAFSIVKKTDIAIYNTLKEYLEGYWYGGGHMEYGLAENVVNIVYNEDYVIDEDIKMAVEELRLHIINGDIVVPTDKKSYIEYVETLKNKIKMER